jgi:menaquinone-dependent protoporphyrinogen oxidase
MKTLIVYGTRYGATAGTSEEIAKVLREEGLDVKVVNAKEEKVKDISSYELIVVGSGMQMGRWTGEAEDFLKKFQKDIAQKKVAIFVSSAVKSSFEREGKQEDLKNAWKLNIEDKVANYGLNPIAVAMFGGVIDYNKMNVITRKLMGSMRKQLEADGFKETQPGVFETRDWEEIRKWARELAKKAQSNDVVLGIKKRTNHVSGWFFESEN